MSGRNRPLRAVLLAAGKGTRMKTERPKVLHDVLGKSIIERVMDAVIDAGVEHIHLIVGYQHEILESALEQNPPSVPYSCHLQEPQLGTGHAVMQAVPELKNYEGDLLISVGDVPLLSRETLASLVEEHRSSQSVATLLSTVVDAPGSYGRVLRDESGSVIGIVEAKDATPEQLEIDEINTGIYVFRWPEIESGLSGLSNDNKQGEYYLTDLIAWAKQNGHKMSARKAEDPNEVAGINSRVELAQAIGNLRDRTVERLALESGVTVVDPLSTWISPEVTIGRDSTVLPGTHIMGEVSIGSDCVLGPNAIIKGKVTIGSRCSVNSSVVLDSVIGDGCKVGPFSHIREGNDLSSGVRVGNFVELKKSDIGSNTNVSHLSYVGDTTIGNGANIGAGTITANYDHLTKTKKRTVIKDGASTGSNSVLVAPCTLGVESVVGAGTVITRDVPDGALAVRRVKQENLEGWSERRKGKKSDTAPTHR